MKPIPGDNIKAPKCWKCGKEYNMFTPCCSICFPTAHHTLLFGSDEEKRKVREEISDKKVLTS